MGKIESLKQGEGLSWEHLTTPTTVQDADSTHSETGTPTTIHAWKTPKPASALLVELELPFAPSNETEEENDVAEHLAENFVALETVRTRESSTKYNLDDNIVDTEQILAPVVSTDFVLSVRPRSRSLSPPPKGKVSSAPLSCERTATSTDGATSSVDSGSPNHQRLRSHSWDGTAREKDAADGPVKVNNPFENEELASTTSCASGSVKQKTEAAATSPPSTIYLLLGFIKKDQNNSPGAARKQQQRLDLYREHRSDISEAEARKMLPERPRSKPTSDKKCTQEDTQQSDNTVMVTEADKKAKDTTSSSTSRHQELRTLKRRMEREMTDHIDQLHSISLHQKPISAEARIKREQLLASKSSLSARMLVGPRRKDLVSTLALRETRKSRRNVLLFKEQQKSTANLCLEGSEHRQQSNHTVLDLCLEYSEHREQSNHAVLDSSPTPKEIALPAIDSRPYTSPRRQLLLRSGPGLRDLSLQNGTKKRGKNHVPQLILLDVNRRLGGQADSVESLGSEDSVANWRSRLLKSSDAYTTERMAL